MVIDFIKKFYQWNFFSKFSVPPPFPQFKVWVLTTYVQIGTTGSLHTYYIVWPSILLHVITTLWRNNRKRLQGINSRWWTHHFFRYYLTHSRLVLERTPKYRTSNTPNIECPNIELSDITFWPKIELRTCRTSQKSEQFVNIELFVPRLSYITIRPCQ